MSRTINSRVELDENTVEPVGAGGERSEPGGRAERSAGIARRSRAPQQPELAEGARELVPDGLIEELLAGVRN